LKEGLNRKCAKGEAMKPRPNKTEQVLGKTKKKDKKKKKKKPLEPYVESDGFFDLNDFQKK